LAEESSAVEERSEPGVITLTVLGTEGPGAQASRSVTGPNAENIVKDSLRNVMQLIVLNGAGEIVSFADVCKETTDDLAVTLPVSVTAGETYHFLFLQGHWPYTAISAAGVYTYDKDKRPTLLQAGFVSAPIAQGANKISIPVRSLVVDAAFVPPADLKMKGVEPEKVGAVSYLIPGEWNLTWTIKQGWFDIDAGNASRAEGNGFEALLNARKILDASAVSPAFKSRKGLVKKVVVDKPPTVSGNVISLQQTFSGVDADPQYANFNLEYMPFGLTNGWDKYKEDSKLFDLSKGPPVWIIRNGINDEAQNANTDYSTMGMSLAKNGNGAVNYKVLDPDADPDNDGIPNRQELQWGMDPTTAVTPLDKDSDGDGFTDVFEAINGFDPDDEKNNPRQAGPGNLVVTARPVEVGTRIGTTAHIQFNTEGYSGTAKGYYKAVAKDDPEPGYNGYDPLNSPAPDANNDLEPGSHDNVAVTIGIEDVAVYVIIMKDGNVSSPAKITLNGNANIGGGW
jgi:hypothetical protein